MKSQSLYRLKSGLRVICIVGLVQVCPNISAADDTGAVAAKIGSMEIKVADIQHLLELQGGSASTMTMADLSELVRQEAVREMLLTKAKASNLDQDPEIKEQMARAIGQVLVNAYLERQSQPPSGYPTEETIRAVYDKNTADFIVPASMHLMQVFASVPPKASAAQDDAIKAAMDAVVESARKGTATFSDLARGHSEDQDTARRGGDLGWIRVDQMRPEFLAALKTMKVGEISAPIRDPQGWHVLKLIEQKDARTMSFAEAHDAIVQALRRKAIQDNQLAYLRKLLAENPVVVDEIALTRLLQTKK